MGQEDKKICKCHCHEEKISGMQCRCIKRCADWCSEPCAYAYNVPTQSETVKMVHFGDDVVIYEGGWWMKREDYNKIWLDKGEMRLYPRKDIGISWDEKTKQLKIFMIPSK